MLYIFCVIFKMTQKILICTYWLNPSLLFSRLNVVAYLLFRILFSMQLFILSKVIVGFFDLVNKNELSTVRPRELCFF